MKTRIENQLFLSALIAGLGLIPTGRAIAQTFTTLYQFSEVSGSLSTNTDGARPLSSLTVSSNVLYGTTRYGGNSGNGAIFALSTDNGSATLVHSFSEVSGPLSANNDGANPRNSMILSGGTLFGTTGYGGHSGNGALFSVNTDGTGFKLLHSFSATTGDLAANSDGAFPQDGVVLAGDTLFGTAYFGGQHGRGTVFAVNTNGTGFKTLHHFTATFDTFLYSTNSDGAGPAGLTLSGNTLYGTAQAGGSLGFGVLFALNTNGTGFINLHSFTARAKNSPIDGGSVPNIGLIVSSNTLYGTTASSDVSDSGYGTVFAVETDGTDFRNLHVFTAPDENSDTNSDGAYPNAGLILSGSVLYGTTGVGGATGFGTVFAINTSGSDFKTLHNFSLAHGSFPDLVNRDGFAPTGLALAGNTLYGATGRGGLWASGTVFSFSLDPATVVPPPQPVELAVTRSGANIILSWPVSGGPLILQSSTNLASPVAWSDVSSAPGVLGGQNNVTNPVSSPQRFYRLSSISLGTSFQ